jgi:hypothetical protein
MPAKSLAQAQMMGMARAIQKGEMAPKPGTPSAKVAATAAPSDVAEFATTPQAGLPKRVKVPAKSSMIGGKMKMKNVGKPVKKFRF